VIDLIKELEIPAHIPAHLDAPDFERKGRVHDWRNYVPTALQRNWGELSPETRLAIYAVADMQADAENWE
jgi:hypothetical protein